MALKFRHAGQACITSNRIYVQRGVYDKFTDLLNNRTKALKVGHGIEKDTTMGPLTTPAGLEKTAKQIEDAQKQGATIVTGGHRLDQREGYYFEPTIIRDARDGMLVSKEETFGPLLALFPFKTEEEVVAAANNTSVSDETPCSRALVWNIRLTYCFRWAYHHISSRKMWIVRGGCWKTWKLA